VGYESASQFSREYSRLTEILLEPIDSSRLAAEVDILSGKTTALDYLIWPVVPER
jgi:hypothetical protein